MENESDIKCWEKIMIEAIENGAILSQPSKNVLYYLDMVKSIKANITVAEIGVGVGATSVEIVKRLDERDTFYFFSYEDDVNELKKDLERLDFCYCTLHAKGNSHHFYDSYNWQLLKMLLNQRKVMYKEEQGLFDLVYLDGAHTFFHDGLACALLKELMKRGGILIFDDVHWTLRSSPTMNPEVNPNTSKRFTEEQIEAEQIFMVIKAFMENDKDWKRVGEIGWQTVYRKIK